MSVFQSSTSRIANVTQPAVSRLHAGKYRPGALHKRKPTWSKDNPGGRWRCYEWAELEKRDKLDLDLTWLKDDSIEDGSNLPEPDELADEMIQDLQNAIELLTEVAQVVTKRPV